MSEAAPELGANIMNLKVYGSWALQKTFTTHQHEHAKNNMMLLTVYTWTAKWLTRLKPPQLLTIKKETLKLHHSEETGSYFQILQIIYPSHVWCHYLVSVYSLSPEWRFMAEKVPMQPRSRLSRPVFHVTKSGLKEQARSNQRRKPWLYPCPPVLPQHNCSLMWAVWKAAASGRRAALRWRRRGSGHEAQGEGLLQPLLSAPLHSTWTHCSFLLCSGLFLLVLHILLLLFTLFLCVCVSQFHPSWRHTGLHTFSPQPHTAPIIISVSSVYKFQKKKVSPTKFILWTSLVVKNTPGNAGVTGSIPLQQACLPQLLHQSSTTRVCSPHKISWTMQWRSHVPQPRPNAAK